MIDLTEKLNTSVEYNGKLYPVNLAFDNVLAFYRMLEDDVLDNEHKFLTAFRMFFDDDAPNDPDFIVTATDALINYIGLQPYGVTESQKDIAGDDLEPTQYYSYTKDAEAIYASFMQCYGISLTRELYKPVNERLHWDEFKALFSGLSNDTYIMRIIDIRSRPVDGLEGKELAELQEAKDHYALGAKYTADYQNRRADASFEAFRNTAKQQKKGG